MHHPYWSERLSKLCVCYIIFIASKKSIAIRHNHSAFRTHKGVRVLCWCSQPRQCVPLSFPIRKLRLWWTARLYLHGLLWWLYYTQCKISMFTVIQYCLAFLYPVFLIGHLFYNKFNSSVTAVWWPAEEGECVVAQLEEITKCRMKLH